MWAALLTLLLDASLLAGSVSRDANALSAIYVGLLLLSLQASSAGPIRVSVYATVTWVTSAACLVVALWRPERGSALLPSSWWSDLIVLATSTAVGCLLVARRCLGSRSLQAMHNEAAGDTTVAADGRPASDANAVMYMPSGLLMIAAVLQPCLVALPVLFVALLALLTFATGLEARSLAACLRVASQGSRAYVGCWLGALYALQLVLNVHHEAPEALYTLGLRRLPWLAGSSPTPGNQPSETTRVAEAQGAFLLAALVLARCCTDRVSWLPASNWIAQSALARAWRWWWVALSSPFGRPAVGADSLSQPLLGAQHPPSSPGGGFEPSTAAASTMGAGGSEDDAAVLDDPSQGLQRLTAVTCASNAFGAILVLSAAPLAPCAASLVLLALGVVALTSPASWARGAPCQTALRVDWLRASLLIWLLWLFVQYVVASQPDLVRAIYPHNETRGGNASEPLGGGMARAWEGVRSDGAGSGELQDAVHLSTAGVETLSRLGAMPSPLLLDASRLEDSIALAIGLHCILLVLLAIVCRTRSLAAKAARRVGNGITGDEDERSTSRAIDLRAPAPPTSAAASAAASAAPPAAHAPTATSAIVLQSQCATTASEPPPSTASVTSTPHPHGTVATARWRPPRLCRYIAQRAAWHSPRLTLLVALAVGVSSFDLLHAVWVAAFLAAAPASAATTRASWWLLTRCTGLIALAQAACLAFAPRQQHSSAPSSLLRLFGLMGPPSEPLERARASWTVLGPTLGLLLVQALQTLVYQSSAYRRALAARRWGAVRARHAPRALARRIARDPWPTITRWVSSAAVLAVAVLPSARLPGLVYISASVAFLYIEQGAHTDSDHRCARRLLWPIVFLTLTAELLVRLAIALPDVFNALLLPGRAALGPQCAFQPGQPPPPTLCGKLLHDLSFDSSASSVRIELAAIAVVASLAAHQMRVDYAAPLLPPPVPRDSSRRSTAASRSTELQDIGRSALLPITALTDCGFPLFSTAGWAVAAHASTVLLLVLSFSCALTYTDAIRGVYLFCAVVSCVLGGWAVRALWLPVGLFSAAVLLVAYLFQLSLTDGWVDQGDQLWIGLARAGGADDLRNILWAVYLPVLLQLFAFAQRQLQLAHRASEWQANVRASAAALALATTRSEPSSPSAAAATSSVSASGCAASSIPPNPVGGAGANWSGADLADVGPSARISGHPSATARGPVCPATRRVRARLAQAAALSRLHRQMSALVYPLLEPLALVALLFAAAIRLNVWALLYASAVCHLRYRTLGPRAKAMSWLATRALLASAIVMQYCARLSLPPSVWSRQDADGGRPWVLWGRQWASAAHECQRLGHPTSKASGVVCYLGLDGTLPPQWLVADFVALAACVLLASVSAPPVAANRVDPACCGPEAAQNEPAQASGAPSMGEPVAGATASIDAAGTDLAGARGEAGEMSVRDDMGTTDIRAQGSFTRLINDTCDGLGVCERWVLRASHFVSLFAIAALASAQNVNSTQGLLSGGYLLFALVLLAKERSLVNSCGRLCSERPRAKWCAHIGWGFLMFYSWAVVFAELLFQVCLVRRTRHCT